MPSAEPFIESVLHPTDFSRASESAFAHALAISIARRARLTVLHAEDRAPDKKTWSSFPGVRDTLVRWGRLEDGSPRGAVLEQLDVEIDKIAVKSPSAVAAIQDFVDNDPTDLIVVATERRAGLSRWLRPSVAERTARKTMTMTLFVPRGAGGFVSLRDGSIDLERVLVPVSRHPRPRCATDAASRMAECFGNGNVSIQALHIGKGFPTLHLPQGPSWTWSTLTRSGELVDEIVHTANDMRADLIVMPTEGRGGLRDALRGSITELVLRRTPCALLAAPTG